MLEMDLNQFIEEYYLPCIKVATIGQNKYSTEIVIQGYNSSLTMLGGGNSSGGGIQNDNTQGLANNSEEAPQSPNDMDDEIPF